MATAAKVLEISVVAAAPPLDFTVMPLEITNSEGAVYDPGPTVIVQGTVDATITLYSVVPFPPVTVWLANPFWQAAMTLRAGTTTKNATDIAATHRVKDTNYLTFLKTSSV